MYRTLILNRSYSPHQVISWEDAVTGMFSGKIEILAQYDETLAIIGRAKLAAFPELAKSLRSVLKGLDVENIEVKVPAVAVLLRNTKHVKSGAKFSRMNVGLRDSFCCGYCGEKFQLSKLTYDHVLPRSRGGRTAWENIVMACGPCNAKKANNTPQEAGMPLRIQPHVPKVLPMHRPVISIADAPPEWLPYIEHMGSQTG